MLCAKLKVKIYLSIFTRKKYWAPGMSLTESNVAILLLLIIYRMKKEIKCRKRIAESLQVRFQGQFRLFIIIAIE